MDIFVVVIAIRSSFHRFVRQPLSSEVGLGFDSPLLVVQFHVEESRRRRQLRPPRCTPPSKPATTSIGSDDVRKRFGSYDYLQFFVLSQQQCFARELENRISFVAVCFPLVFWSWESTGRIVMSIRLLNNWLSSSLARGLSKQPANNVHIQVLTRFTHSPTDNCLADHHLRRRCRRHQYLLLLRCDGISICALQPVESMPLVEESGIVFFLPPPHGPH